MLIVLKSGSLNLLKPSEPVQACNGIALPSTNYIWRHRRCSAWVGAGRYPVAYPDTGTGLTRGDKGNGRTLLPPAKGAWQESNLGS